MRLLSGVLHERVISRTRLIAVCDPTSPSSSSERTEQEKNLWLGRFIAAGEGMVARLCRFQLAHSIPRRRPRSFSARPTICQAAKSALAADALWMLWEGLFFWIGFRARTSAFGSYFRRRSKLPTLPQDGNESVHSWETVSIQATGLAVCCLRQADANPKQGGVVIPIHSNSDRPPRYA